MYVGKETLNLYSFFYNFIILQRRDIYKLPFPSVRMYLYLYVFMYNIRMYEQYDIKQAEHLSILEQLVYAQLFHFTVSKVLRQEHESKTSRPFRKFR